MPASYLGVHIKTGQGLGSALREAHAMGCTALQVFTSSPRMWKSAAPSSEKIVDFLRAMHETGLNRVISHDSYLVNLCHSDLDVAETSHQALRDEIARCHLLGIESVVSHIGSLKGRPQEEGFGMVASHLKSILAETPSDVKLLMETTAGQGSAINSRFEEIAQVLDLCGGHPQLGVCLDSCHVFAAGYDIRTEEAYAQTMKSFDDIVGIRNLKAIHLNDSKKPFGSRVDRHDNLGKGEIGLDAFSYFVNDPRLEEIPMVVETPVENEGHEKDLAALFALRK